MYIAIEDHSTICSDNDVAAMTQACANQMRYHAAPAWGRDPAAVVYHPAGSPIPPGAHIIGVFDDSDQSGALGWHTEEAGEAIYGRVFARPVLDHGAAVLTGGLSVASVLSHEVLEMFCDASCALWVDDRRGTLHALEVCDPVEADGYPVIVNGVEVTVSNFVYPSWFDALARPDSQFDQLKRCRRPFQLLRGGYEIIRRGSQEQQRFGAEYEAVSGWRQETRATLLARSTKRLAMAEEGSVGTGC